MANSSDDGSEARSKQQDDARESAPPEVNEGAERASSERSSSPPEAEVAEEGRAARPTERPVAHSVKPPPPAPSSKRGFVWVAVLALFGVVGFALRTPEATRAPAARAPGETPPTALEPSSPKSEPSPSLARTSAPSEPATAASPAEPATPEPAAQVAPANAALAANAQRAPEPAARRAAAAPVVAARTLTPPAQDSAPLAPSAAAPPKPAAFSLKAANTSLDRSAKAASTCRRGTDPSGVARAVVSFAPTGRVTAAVISGPPFAGTETGSCIARALRQSVIPEFEGPITTVAKTVEVQ